MGISIACARACICARLLVIVISAGAPGIAQAQSGAVGVTGSVTASDGTPIAGAPVVLVMQGTSKTVRSDARGRFIIANVAPGTYSFAASAPGYETISQRR